MDEYTFDTIGRHIKLTQRGSKYLALCPFHREETPSFVADPSTHVYHCFGCEAHGHFEDFAHDLERAAI